MIVKVDVDGIAIRLRRARCKLGLSYHEAGTLCSIRSETIKKIETCERKPSVDTIAELCRAYGINQLFVLTGKNSDGDIKNLPTNLEILITRKTNRKHYIAGRMGVSPETIHKWRNGDCWPTVKNLHMLAWALDMSLHDLLAPSDVLRLRSVSK